MGVGTSLTQRHRYVSCKGNDQCALTITLPLALEGEMTPELASARRQVR
jgi:hypothetical protein